MTYDCDRKKAHEGVRISIQDNSVRTAPAYDGEQDNDHWAPVDPDSVIGRTTDFDRRRLAITSFDARAHKYSSWTRRGC